MALIQYLGQSEILKPLQKYSSTQVKLPAGSQFKLGSIWWVLTGDLYYTTSSPAANTLYAVYAYNNSGVIALTASTTMPSAIGAGYKLVGAYHTDSSALVSIMQSIFAPIAFTPTKIETVALAGHGVVTSVSVVWWIEDGDMGVRYLIGSQGTDTGALNMALPAGVTVDTGRLVNSGSTFLNAFIGQCTFRRWQTSAKSLTDIVHTYDNVSGRVLWRYSLATSGDPGAIIGTDFQGTGSSLLGGQFRVPILEYPKLSVSEL